MHNRAISCNGWPHSIPALTGQSRCALPMSSNFYLSTFPLRFVVSVSFYSAIFCCFAVIFCTRLVLYHFTSICTSFYFFLSYIRLVHIVTVAVVCMRLGAEAQWYFVASIYTNGTNMETDQRRQLCQICGETSKWRSHARHSLRRISLIWWNGMEIFITSISKWSTNVE